MSIETLGGRKYILTVLAVILGFVLVMMSRVEASEFMSFIKWVIGLYLAGNVANKAVTNTSP